MAALFVTVSSGVTASAVVSNSTNYQVTETEFTAGTGRESCSGQYCAQTTMGDMTTGGKSVGTSTAVFGAIAGDEPLLEVIVDVGESDLGVLTTERTATKTSIVRVRNYQSNGYVIQIAGEPPKYASHTMQALLSPTESSAGTEQFGLNVVANSSPGVGADPVQVPSGAFSFGVAESGYSTPNRFKYVSEDIVARSTKESGRTDYTISMIVNVSGQTPAGRFTGDYSAIVTPVY